MSTEPRLLMAEMPALPKPITGSPAETIAVLATNDIMDDIVKGRVTFLVAYTFRENGWRRWQLHNVDEADDVIRAIAKQEAAEAVAVVHPMPVPKGIDGDRVMNIAAECRQGKFDHLIVFKGTGARELFKQMGARHPAGAPCRWFGVEPDGEVEMWFEGIAGLTGSTKGEA